MPILNFPGNGLDSQYLYSVMTYPNDTEAQERLIHATGCHHYTAGPNYEDQKPLPMEVVRRLAHSGSYEEENLKAAKKAAVGMMAGNVLVFMARMVLSGYEEPSLRKAETLFSFYYARATNANGDKAPSSKPKMKQYQSEFASVIHLWAAYNICNTPNTANYLENFRIDVLQNMAKFLSVSEWFRRFAEEFTPSRQGIAREVQKRFAGQNVLLAAGDAYAISEPIVTWDFLEDWMVQELHNYRAVP